ncbi:MAG: helicase-related protein [Sandaracinaceae bacterium]
MASDLSIVAALGPTNTGKTHRAVTRLLEHESGMIGLPLRLLAREVYDRVTAKVGEAQVALVTGEEKRIPNGARYWICTVEAMPVGRTVDFLAVDEIQLAAHRERGHVFTERLLHARGRRETWFLGADTMAPLIRGLLPRADVQRRPRFSTLRHAGRSGLGALPPRSAVVAFRTDEVYELAARLRHRRGGAAVVLGALSPRTRNAQVALYQAREVGYVVATDAIGMGLNLDVDHVAFASVQKFDGRERRPLAVPELAQIAGRAGRHRRDGTFGTLSPLPAFDPTVARRLEEHRFGAVRRLVWRNADLDLSSVDALIASLAQAPPEETFVRVERADDFDALRALAARRDVRDRATSPASVALLWEVCQVPDYRKLLLLRHLALLEELYRHLADGQALPADVVARQVARIDRTDGDVDHLTARLASIRVWTYLSHQAGWLPDARHWRGRTRQVEDRLSDALHQRLVERFVATGRRRTVPLAPRRGQRPSEGPFAALAELLADEAPSPGPDDDVDRVVDAPHDAFTLEADGRVRCRGAVVGQLAPGRSLLAPEVRAAERLGPGARSRVHRRLAAFLKDLVRELLLPLRPGSEVPSGPVRGLLYQLEGSLGTVLRRAARRQVDALSADDEAALRELGVHVGARAVYASALLEARALRQRGTLVRVLHPAAVPTEPVAWVATDRSVPSRAYLAAGYVPVGPRALRADVLESLVTALRAASAVDEAPALPEAVVEALGRPGGDEQARILGALGFEMLERGRYRRRRRSRRRRRPRVSRSEPG